MIIFIASFIHMPFGEGGGLENEVVLSTCETNKFELEPT